MNRRALGLQAGARAAARGMARDSSDAVGLLAKMVGIQTYYGTRKKGQHCREPDTGLRRTYPCAERRVRETLAMEEMSVGRTDVRRLV